MKLSISTLGCPDWGFARVVEEFEKLDVDIEVRGVDGEMEAGRIARFSPERAQETKAFLAAHGRKLVGFGTSCKFHDPATQEENVRAGWEAAEVCARMDIPFLRVFGNDIPDAARAEETVALACKGIRRVCERAEPLGVQTLLEVHGDFNTVEVMRQVAQEMAGAPGFGILWDVEHSDKTCGDDFRPFYEVVRPLLRHVHVKDYHRGENGHFTLCPMGEGDIPLPEILHTLVQDGYDGYFSFEWEKKWVPSLAEPEEAFPAFVRYMRAL
ncbi:MAG: sugar phosphate isomerase/epimerase family protein [Candidatus Spyradocola sp.]|jgi:sugar phosphate isomerase/epimerase